MMTITEASTEELKQGKLPDQITIAPQQENVISVCGVMVLIHPDKRESTEAKMLEIEGLEIHGASDEGKLVITVQTDSYRATGDAITRLQHVPGILSISMIYQHAECLDDVLDEAEDEAKPIQPAQSQKQAEVRSN